MLLLLLACAPAVPSTGDTAADADTDIDADTDTDTDADTDTPEDTAPVDADDDGSVAADDCDDADAAVHPGAEELWNDQDDDCDGVADADGSWSGEVTMYASAIYEGHPYSFQLRCPFTGTRAGGVLEFTITCTPDADDEMAQLLLGETLTVTPDDTDVAGEAWDDDVMFTSSNGWDSRGDGTITWSSFDAAAVAVSLGGVSLAAEGSGGIDRD